LDQLVLADEQKRSEVACKPSPPQSSSAAVAAVSAACASRLLARLAAELTIFARPLPWGSSVCDQFFTILGQSISTDSAKSAFLSGLKLGGTTSPKSSTDTTGDGAVAGVVYRMVPSLIHSFIGATRDIKGHPTFGSFKVNPVSQPSAKLPLPKPKPKPVQQSELERRIIEMGFPVLKVQLAMRRNPSLTDADNERHLSGLMEAALSLDDDDVELRALEEEQMAAAIQNTASAASEPAAGDTLPEPVASAADPIMMKFFGLSAALRYCLVVKGFGTRQAEATSAWFTPF